MNTNEKDWMGGFNDAPPNFTEITQQQFYEKFESFFIVLETRKVHKQILPRRNCVNSYFFVDDKSKQAIGLEIIHYPEHKVKYYFAAECLHEYDHISPKMCLHVYTCKKCQYKVHQYSDD